MTEEREMAAADEGREVRLSEELDKLRKEAGELMTVFQAAAATTSTVRSIMASADAHLIRYAAVFFFFPGGGSGALRRLGAGLFSTTLGVHIFIEAGLSKSTRMRFLARGPVMAERVRELRGRVVALGATLAAADQRLAIRCEQLRDYIDGFPGVDGPWPRFRFVTVQAMLMVLAGGYFLGGLLLLYAACSNLQAAIRIDLYSMDEPVHV